jgi:sulfofructose kinase
MISRFDVLGLGVVSVDDLLSIEGYPPPDSKVPVLGRERRAGGLTASALVAAARLGSRCAYAGRLGEDELSRFAEESLRREGIDLSHRVKCPEASPVHSTIIVDRVGRTRNIFFEIRGATGAHPQLPAEEVIRSAQVLFVDHHGMEGMIRAARIARESGIPVVADFEREGDPRFPELLALADHLILSRDFAGRLTGKADPAASAAALWREDRKAVVVTGGEEGAWFVSAEDPGRATRQPAFAVDAVDTTGCGDVFHGAYASALARRLALAERIRFASAAAALKATRAGAQSAPSRAEVEAFLAAR